MIQKEEEKSTKVATVHRVDEDTIVVLGLKPIPAERSFAFAKILFERMRVPDEYCALKWMNSEFCLSRVHAQDANSAQLRTS